MADRSMKISEYIKEYTSGEPVAFKRVISEVNELLIEIVRLNKDGIREEFEDTCHFIQLWLNWQFGIDGEIWKVTKNSVRKFMDRKSVWNKIYIFVGLPENISGYVGNYKKIEKVVNQLQKFGIEKERAVESYRKIVVNKQ